MFHYRSCLVFLGLISIFPFLQGCIAAAAGGAATGAAVATDRRTAGTMVDDQAIELKANHAISRQQLLWKQSHINVVSYNNVVLLVGQTPREEYKKEVEEIVSDIPKIRRIHNELSIGSPVSLQTRSHDSWITTQLKAKLVGSQAVSATHIKVITENSVVYLLGLTTPEEELAVTEIARAIPGVEKVVQIFEPT